MLCHIVLSSFMFLTKIYIELNLAVLFSLTHYDDVLMGAMASLITSLTVAYSTIYSDADQRKYQSSTSLAFVWGIHRGPRTNGQYDVIMNERCGDEKSSGTLQWREGIASQFTGHTSVCSTACSTTRSSASLALCEWNPPESLKLKPHQVDP